MRRQWAWLTLCAEWESLRARDAFLRSAAYEAHARHLTVQRGPFLVTLSEDDHAACDAIFTAPVQKFGFLQASTPQGREKAHGLLKLMRSGRQERRAKKEIMGELDAAVVDNADCCVIMDGWESVEVRASVLSDTVPIAEDLLLDIRVCLPLN